MVLPDGGGHEQQQGDNLPTAPTIRIAWTITTPSAAILTVLEAAPPAVSPHSLQQHGRPCNVMVGAAFEAPVKSR
jgi:hypothetical protein